MASVFQHRMAVHPARRGRIRHPWRIAAIVGALVVTGLVIGLAPIVSFSSEAARAQVVAVLSDRLDGEVQLDTLRGRVFPRLRVEGSGLSIRHKGRRDVPPLISIKSFSAEGNLLALYRKHIPLVTVDGLEMQIPPDRNRDVDATGTTDRVVTAKGQTDTSTRDLARTLVIDELLSTAARLVIIPAEKEKQPKVWDIHRLRMAAVSVGQPMPFVASLANAVPPGEIETRGTFGPWRSEKPGQTALDGTFIFDRADLGVFRGISGLLSAHGTFGGVLGRIDIHGETETPDFNVTAGGHPMPLHTTYHAIVDGTNGNTLLERVDGNFLNTSLVAKGGVADTPGKEGRTVTLDIVMDHGRLEDVLRLAVKTPHPPMTGALQLKTTLVLPPGDQDVVKKLRLDGRFSIAGTRFTDLDVQHKINELSRRSRGQAAKMQSQRVASQFHGAFSLRAGRLTIPEVTFDIPGAVVRLAGTYDLVPETLNFRGMLFMDAKVSDTTTGIKRLLLKIVDPIFRKDGGGSKIPIQISGKRSDPSFGLDKGRLFKRQ